MSFAEPATSYRITYRVRTAAGDDVAESTEEIAARRPFATRVEIRAGGEVTARRVSRFGELVIEGDDGVRVLGVPPALGTSDVRADPALDDAVDRGLAERREVREVAGRRCRVYRVGSSASDGTLVPVGTTGGEHADVCVDGRGLVLEEWWVQQGHPLRHRVAIEVDDDAVLDDETFVLPGEPRRGPTDGGVVEIADDPGARGALPGAFERLGRFEVTSAQLQQPTGDTPPVRTSVSDVWTRGPDLLVLDRGVGTLPPTPYGMPVEVSGVGPAELVVDLRASELRFTTADGDTVRLYGTVSPSGLIQLAADLVS